MKLSLCLRCALPGWTNDTYIVQNDAHQELINATIPQGSKCTVYNSSGLNETKCSSWVYDETYFSPSAVMEVRPSKTSRPHLPKSLPQAKSYFYYFLGIITQIEGNSDATYGLDFDIAMYNVHWVVDKSISRK
jgi:hypothetical protein